MNGHFYSIVDHGWYLPLVDNIDIKKSMLYEIIKFMSLAVLSIKKLLWLQYLKDLIDSKWHMTSDIIEYLILHVTWLFYLFIYLFIVKVLQLMNKFQN